MRTSLELMLPLGMRRTLFAHVVSRVRRMEREDRIYRVQSGWNAMSDADLIACDPTGTVRTLAEHALTPRSGATFSDLADLAPLIRSVGSAEFMRSWVNAILLAAERRGSLTPDVRAVREGDPT